jgi:hypothetical protein
MEAFENAPPRIVSSKPNIPWASPDSFEGSTPGSTTNEPSLKIIRNPRVLKILSLSSSMENIFFMVEKKRFIL